MQTNRPNDIQTTSRPRRQGHLALGLVLAAALGGLVSTVHAQGPSGRDLRTDSVAELSPAMVASVPALLAGSPERPQVNGLRTATPLATGTSPGASTLQVILILVLGLIQFIPRSDTDEVRHEWGRRSTTGGGEA